MYGFELWRTLLERKKEKSRVSRGNTMMNSEPIRTKRARFIARLRSGKEQSLSRIERGRS